MPPKVKSWPVYCYTRWAESRLDGLTERMLQQDIQRTTRQGNTRRTCRLYDLRLQRWT